MHDQLIAQPIVQRELSDRYYVLSEIPQSAEKVKVPKKPDENVVYRIILPTEEAKRLGLPSQIVYYKEIHSVENPANLPLVLKYQIVAANLYRCLLGPDFAPEIRLVVGVDGKPKGIISSEMPNFQTLRKIIEEGANNNLQPGQPRFPKDSDFDDVCDFRLRHYFPEKVVHQLVEDGLLPVYVVSYFLANRDAHFDNVGYSNGKNCIIDFDQALWPFAETLYTDEAEDNASVESKAIERMPLMSCDLGNKFVNLPHKEPFAWFNKNIISVVGNREDTEYDETPVLAERVESAPDFIDQQFFSLLKILFTPPQDIQEAIRVIEDEKERTKLFEFLMIKTRAWTDVCFNNDQFCNWLLINKENLEQRLLDSCKNDYTEVILLNRSELIKDAFRGFLKQVEQEFSGEELHDSSEHSFDDISDTSIDSKEFISLSDSEHESEESESTAEQSSAKPKHGTSPFILMPAPTSPRVQDVVPPIPTPNLNYN